MSVNRQKTVLKPVRRCTSNKLTTTVGEQWARGRALDCQGTVQRGSIPPPTAVSKLSFTPHFLCRSKETLKAGGPFYMVSMAGEVTYPTRGGVKCVTCSGSQILVGLYTPCKGPRPASERRKKNCHKKTQ